MAKLLIPLVVVCLLVKEVVSQGDSSAFEYDFFPSEPTDLAYIGDAHIPPGSSFVRLTKTDASGKPQTHSTGYILHKAPVVFWEATGKLHLETTIMFSITAVDDYPADGITFFITGSFNQHTDGTGGNFGIFDPQTGTHPGLFAVEFDIFTNVWDPNFRHIGIDIQSRESFAPKNFDLPLQGQPVTALITYDETNHITTVTVTSGSTTYTTSYDYNLRDILSQNVYVGISSSTGDQVAVHDIHSWHFSSRIVHTAADADADADADAVEEDSLIQQVV